MVYDPEIDSQIRRLLQKLLDENGHPHVVCQSFGNNSSRKDYPYSYQLTPSVQDSEWKERFLPNVKQALYERLAQNSGLDFIPDRQGIHIRLKPDSPILVAQATIEK